MSDYSNLLPSVGDSFDAPKKGLHIAHSNPDDGWAIYVAGSETGITIACYEDSSGLKVVFLADRPNLVGYMRSYSGWASDRVALNAHDTDKDVYYGVLAWQAPILYTGMPFNGSVSDPFRIFSSIEDIIGSYEPGIVTKTVTVSWQREDGKTLTTTFDIKVKQKEFEGGGGGSDF